MPMKQFQLKFEDYRKRSREQILKSITKLRKMHQLGLLGGEKMPEDANPNLPKNSIVNYNYFTLPMALNYQRNSYKLWQSANQTYNDNETKDIFDPKLVLDMNNIELKNALIKYKVALQPVKHTEIWKMICESICSLLNSDIRNLFIYNDRYVPNILNFIQIINKKRFPYLSGPKICNYWLYVIDQYTDVGLTGKEALTIAPDTHVIQASIKLGLIDIELKDNNNIQEIVNNEWKKTLDGTGIMPIDIHTPLWLWSRSGFITITN